MAKKLKGRVEPNDIRECIRQHIKEKYGMTTSQFAISEHVINAGVFASRAQINSVLSMSGPISVPIMKRLWEYLKIPGEIKKKTEVVRTVNYYVD